MTFDVSKNHADATKNPRNFKAGDLAYALDNAAEFLENEEWPEATAGAAQEGHHYLGAPWRARCLVAHQVVEESTPCTRQTR